MKAAAASGEAKTYPDCAMMTTDTDPGFTLGAGVLVGGVKPGRLRYVGGVHFVAGLWCGVELEDPDGLHDGVVDGVRYFTCREGHGIFAPHHRVTLRPPLQGRSPCGSPDVRMRALRKPTVNVSHSGSVEDGDVGRPLRVASPRHRHQASLDGRDLDFLSTPKSGSARPQSAVLPDDELQGATTESSFKRSSLVTGRLAASDTPRSSPKRVTFFDQIINSKERGVPTVRTDVRVADRRQRGHGDVDDDYQLVNSDIKTAMTLTNDFDEGSPSRKTSRTDKQRPSSAERSLIDRDLGNHNMGLETTDLLTSNQELLLSSDSIDANDIDNDFNAYRLASVTKPKPKDVVQHVTSQAPAYKSPKTRVDEALNDLELMVGRQQNKSSDFIGGVRGKPSSSEAHGTPQSVATSSTASASFELARTALAQYADLVRAAQESSAVRQTWTPPVVRRSLPLSTPATTSSSAAVSARVFGYDLAEPPPKNLVGGAVSCGSRLNQLPAPAVMLDSGGSGSSGSADEVDFETFDGEELDSIGDAMIDSIDGSSVQSEDSIAMLPHLSDVEDDDVAETGRDVVDDPSNQVTTGKDAVTASELLLSTTRRDHDNGNAVDFQRNERTTVGGNNSNNVVDVNLLNDFNDAVSCRQLAFSGAQPYRQIGDIGENEESLVVVIADSQVATMTTGSASDIDYFLRQSTTIRDERPMSLISSSSSTDTGA